MATKQLKNYYYLDEKSSTVYYNLGNEADRPDLVFLGSSSNPNKKMVAATFLAALPEAQKGWTIKPLPLF